MYYIKLENGGPSGHPMLGGNLKDVLEVSYLDQQTLDKYGYAPFEFTPLPTQTTLHVNATNEYFLAEDGIVRNRIEVREFTQDEKLETFIRAPRSHLLALSDWTQANDSPLSKAKKAEWATYRQALRDLTADHPTVETAADVVWPTKPE